MEGSKASKDFLPLACSCDLDVALENGIKVYVLAFFHLENSCGLWIASEMVLIISIFSFPFVYFF